MNVSRRIKLTLIARLFLKIRGGGARFVRPALIGHYSRAGAQGGRAGALPLGSFGLPFVPVAFGLFLVEENFAAHNYLVVNLTCGPSLHIF